eukprot:TRINITY_DN10610_c0_g1_i1.p1 TRINITY_DN10610_c0_g1~~TRINITY_DN10610_c0_g1_i1.p1  ORF type:complete len:1928 (+),score=533.09 TRINITY_DN10610_c0_g1_i1:596-5785(+)
MSLQDEQHRARLQTIALETKLSEVTENLESEKRDFGMQLSMHQSQYKMLEAQHNNLTSELHAVTERAATQAAADRQKQQMLQTRVGDLDEQLRQALEENRRQRTERDVEHTRMQAVISEIETKLEQYLRKYEAAVDDRNAWQLRVTTTQEHATEVERDLREELHLLELQYQESQQNVERTRAAERLAMEERDVLMSSKQRLQEENHDLLSKMNAFQAEKNQQVDMIQLQYAALQNEHRDLHSKYQTTLRERQAFASELQVLQQSSQQSIEDLQSQVLQLQDVQRVEHQRSGEALADLDMQRALLQQQLDRVTNELKDAKHLAALNQERVQALNSEKVELEISADTKLRASVAERNESATLYQSTNQQLQVLQQQFNALRQERTELDNALQRLLHEHQQQERNSGEQLSALQSQRNNLNEQVQRLRTELSSLQSEHHSLNSDHAMLQQQFEKLRVDRDAQAEMHQEQLKRMRAESATVTASFEGHQNEKQAIIKSQEAQIQALQAEQTRLTSAIAQLNQDKLNQSQAWTVEHGRTEARIAELSAKVQEAETTMLRETRILQQKVNELTADNERLKRSAAELQQSLVAAQSEAASKSVLVVRLRDELSQQASGFSALQFEHERTTEQLAHVTADSDRQLTILRTRQTELQVECDKVQQLSNQLSTELIAVKEDRSSQLSRLKDELARVQDALSESNRNLSALQIERSDLERQFANQAAVTQDQLRQATQAATANKSAFDALQAKAVREASELRAAVDAAQEQLSAMSSEHADALATIADLRQRLDTATTERQTLHETSIARIHQSESEAAQLRQQAMATRNELERTTSQLASLQQDFERQVQNLNHELAVTRDDNAVLRSELRKCEDTLQVVRDEAAIEHQQSAAAHREVSDHALSLNEQLSKTKTELTKEREANQRTRSELQGKMNALDEAVRNALANLEAQKEINTRQNVIIEQQHHAYDNEIQKMRVVFEGRLQQLDTQNSEIQANLAARESQLQQIQQDYSNDSQKWQISMHERDEFVVRVQAELQGVRAAADTTQISLQTVIQIQDELKENAWALQREAAQHAEHAFNDIRQLIEDGCNAGRDVVAVKDHNFNLTKNLERLKTELAEIKAKFDIVTKQHSDAQVQVQALQAKLRLLETENAEERRSLSANFQQDMQRVRDELALCKRSRDDVQVQLELSNQQRQAIYDAHAQVEQTLLSQQAQCERDASELKGQVAVLQRQVREAREKLETSERGAKRQSITQQARIDQLTKQIDDQATQLHSLEQQKKILGDQAAVAEQNWQRKHGELVVQLSALKEKSTLDLQTNIRKIEDLTRELENAQRAYDDVVHERAALQSDRVASLRVTAELEQKSSREIHALQTANTALTRSKEVLEKQLSTVKAQLDALQQTHNVVVADKQQQENLLRSLQAEFQAFVDASSSKELAGTRSLALASDQLKQAEASLQAVASHRQQLQSDHAALQEQFQSLQSQYNAASAKNAEDVRRLQQELSSCRLQKETLESKVSELQGRVDALTRDIVSRSEELAQVAQSTAELQATAAIAADSHDRLLQHTQTQLQEEQRASAQVRRQLVTAQQSLAELDQACTNLQRENSHLKATLSSLESSALQSQQRTTSNQQALDAERSSLSLRVSSLSEELAKTRSSLTSTESELTRVQKEAEKALHDLGALQLAHEQLNSQFHVVESQNRQLQIQQSTTNSRGEWQTSRVVQLEEQHLKSSQRLEVV